MSFADRLVLLRKSHNLTQKQLATEMRLSELAIQHYEAQRRKPAFDVLISLADYFDVPLDYLTCRGIYRHWDKLMEQKEEFIHVLLSQVPPEFSFLTEDLLLSLPEKSLMALVDALWETADYNPDTNTYLIVPRAL